MTGTLPRTEWYWIKMLNIKITEILELERGLGPELSPVQEAVLKYLWQRALKFYLKPARDITNSQSSLFIF